LYLSTLSP
jgi:hypothetical protein